MKRGIVKQVQFNIYLALFVSGILLFALISCNTTKKEKVQLTGKSTAHFDYFSYKGEDDFYFKNKLPDDVIFSTPFCRAGIPIQVSAPTEKITFW